MDGSDGGSAGVLTWTDGDTIYAGTFSLGADPLVTTLVVAQNAGLQSAGLRSAQAVSLAPSGELGVAVGPDGDFVVVWNSGGSIIGQPVRFDGLSAGALATPPLPGATTSDPDVVMTPGGDFVIVWNSEPADDGPGSVMGATFDGDGSPLNEFLIDPGPGDLSGRPHVTMNADGTFVVGYSQVDATASTIDLVTGDLAPGMGGATVGPPDTIVRRLADPDAGPGAMVGIELVALSLTSVEPIVVTIGDHEQSWGVVVNLSSLGGSTELPPLDLTETDFPIDSFFDVFTPLNLATVPGLEPLPDVDPYFHVGTDGAGNVNQLWGDWFLVDPMNSAAFGDNLVHIEASGTPETGLTDPSVGPTFYGRYVGSGVGGEDTREPLARTWMSGVTNPIVTRDGQPAPNWTSVHCDDSNCALGQSNEGNARGVVSVFAHDTILRGGNVNSQTGATTGAASGQLVEIINGVDTDGDGSWDFGIFVTPGGETRYVQRTSTAYGLIDQMIAVSLAPELLLVPTPGGNLPAGPLAGTSTPIDTASQINGASVATGPVAEDGTLDVAKVMSLPSTGAGVAGTVQVERSRINGSDFANAFLGAFGLLPRNFDFANAGTLGSGAILDNDAVFDLFQDDFGTGAQFDDRFTEAVPNRRTAGGEALRVAQTDVAAFACSGLCFAAAQVATDGDSSVWLVDDTQAGAGTNFIVSESQPWAARVSGIPHGSRDMSVRLTDFTGDGVLDLAIGVPGDDSAGRRSATDEAGAIYLLPGPLSGGRLQDLTARRISGSPGDRLGGGFDFADLDGDGVLDLVGGAGGLDRGSTPDVGGVHVYLGVPPTIDAVETANGFTTITGSNLDSLVFIDDVRAAPLRVSSTEVILGGTGSEYTVRGAFGSDTLATGRLVRLQPGWNLVGWSGATAVGTALETFNGDLNTLLTWNASTQAFQSFTPSLPAVLNSLSDLAFGSGVWINVASG
ncbi:MAG TPA: VCBS repeat-containing protein [Dehalococcoidia bacterium]|nr:VCBS repeat-containing protein [Dehalococcoidia bacterium]